MNQRIIFHSIAPFFFPYEAGNRFSKIYWEILQYDIIFYPFIYCLWIFELILNDILAIKMHFSCINK